MLHLDVKKVGKIPDGGGWWAHGRGSSKALASKRAHKQPTCTRQSMDTPGWRTPKRLKTRPPRPRSGSSPGLARTSQPMASRASFAS
jgi:hypothetical protein